VPYLIPGTYTLSAEATDYKKWVRSEIQVRINDSVEVNADLQVGATTETIEVKDTTPLLSTAEASLGLPLFAGNAMDLVHLAPGTAISEFGVQTTAFDASLGHTMGSTVNVSTKSGTNALHGEMHHWLRHSAFDAPTIFDNRAGQKLPIYQDKRYGFSVGAPVTVPTAKMRTGDLPEWLARGAGYQVYDPRSTQLVNGRFVRQPIPGNIIPASRLDAVGMNLINLYPLPNQAGTG
jgi:hypothetical protein